MVISHDRYLIASARTFWPSKETARPIGSRGPKEYEENRKKRLGDEGPKRIKYRKLVQG